jgi:hypothetical protein
MPYPGDAALDTCPTQGQKHWRLDPEVRYGTIVWKRTSDRFKFENQSALKLPLRSFPQSYQAKVYGHRPLMKRNPSIREDAS